NANGTFQPPKTFATGPYPQHVAAGDFNGDHKLDLATANLDYYGAGDNDVSILLGNGDGTFAPPAPQIISIPYVYSRNLAAGDLNADGLLDLVVTSDDTEGGACAVSVLRGHGDGTFAPAATYGFEAGLYYSPALADVDGDGNIDVTVAHWAVQDAFVKVFPGN